jgi:hypothetical protein
MSEPFDDQDGNVRRVAQNQDQLRLAEHLIGAARDRLSGRDDSGRQLLDIRPRERIVLGVLQPQPRPIVMPSSSASAVPREPGVPVDHLPASEMGLTALIETSRDTIALDVTTRFALYLQHFPTHQQQAERSGFADEADDGDVDDDDGAGVDEGQGTPDATSTQGGMPQPTLPDEPTAEQLAGVPSDVAAAVQLAVRGARGDVAATVPNGPAQGHAGSTGAHRTVPSDFFRLVYRRYDIEVTHRLEVSVPSDARPHTTTESSSYDHAVTAVVEPHAPATVGRFAGSLFVPMAGRSAMRIPRDVVMAGPNEYETFLSSRARAGWRTPTPQVSFRVTVQRTPKGQLRLSVTLVNDTPQPDRDRGFAPEVSLYDAGFSVSLEDASVVPSEYRVVERDYRTEPLVYAHGRFCCLDEEAFRATGVLRTATMPVHRQLVYESKPELQPSFEDLQREPVSVLEQIARHMAQFGVDWDSYLAIANLPAVAADACRLDRATFADELRRFERGIALIREDLTTGSNGIGAAFVRANQAFALMNRTGGLDHPGEPRVTTWRLFQVVFIVCNLAALAARESSAADRRSWVARRAPQAGAQSSAPTDLDELETADVLWFPTGGGKSAALYGILAVALFYDRLRGKSAGVSSVIRFPLRMLSVQQLERVLRLVVACELVRQARGDGGDQFRLGYWVGKGNTPNKITDPKDQRWHDIGSMQRQNTDWKRQNAVLPSCPYCGESRVALAPDLDTVQLKHHCPDCRRDLPVDVSDDEIYRHLPAVLVCTVDKIAALAHNPHASHLTHGPAWRCPDHGYVTHPQGREGRCLARQHCARPRTEWAPVAIKDPAPALVIQDELHLLSEELGTFAAHYETLWQYLCCTGSGLPSKVLAATATISDYQNQVSQLYALRPRRFPTDGWIDGESFYAERHADLVRRLFVGALPTQMDVVQFALAAGDAVRAELARLADMSPDAALRELGLSATEPNGIAGLLFQYELQCFYCNRKTHADRVHSSADRAGRQDHPRFQSVRLNGQTKLAEISDVIRRVERETLATPQADRLASIAGTSLISHGVDLERLNVLFVLGMPSTIAYYVQASSRAGRSDVGIVFTTLARHYVRDRSVFHFFEPQHRYVNVLVEPVALNRFSTHGPRKTVSGLLAAVLSQQWARDTDLLKAAGESAPIRDLSMAAATRQLLARMRDRAQMAGGPDPLRVAQDAVKSAYGLRSTSLDPHVAALFADTVDRQVESVLASVEGSHESLLTRSMRPSPPRSLRDVDFSADFGAAGYPAKERFKFLGGVENDDDETDYTIADEEV